MRAACPKYPFAEAGSDANHKPHTWQMSWLNEHSPSGQDAFAIQTSGKAKAQYVQSDMH